VFIQSNGNVRKLIESRRQKYNRVEPPLDEVFGKNPIEEGDDEKSHLDMFKQARPIKLSVAVQNDLDKYSSHEEPVLGNKNKHIKAVSSDESSLESELSEHSDQSEQEEIPTI
jgi:hypothetical protein